MPANQGSWKELIVKCFALLFVVLITIGQTLPARGSGVQQLDFQWQSVGHVGNTADPTRRRGGASGFGRVDYHYEINKTPVTNDQYVSFLNAVAAVSDPGRLYASGMQFSLGGIIRTGEPGNRHYESKPDWGSKPVNFVDIYDAMRFANWVNHGQPVGLQNDNTTESGSYTITAEGINLHNITRNLGTGVFLPTEDEWYKAAYHEPIAEGDHYWQYPTRSDTTPSPGHILSSGDMIPGENIANYDSRGRLANVGTAGPLSESYYGVSDLAGHVWEWTESIITADEFINPSPPRSNPPSNGTWRSIMGGSRTAKVPPELDHMSKQFRHPEDPFDGDCCRGFRLVLITVPEPLGAAVSLAAVAVLLTRRNRFV